MVRTVVKVTSPFHPWISGGIRALWARLRLLRGRLQRGRQRGGGGGRVGHRRGRMGRVELRGGKRLELEENLVLERTMSDNLTATLPSEPFDLLPEPLFAFTHVTLVSLLTWPRKVQDHYLNGYLWGVL